MKKTIFLSFFVTILALFSSISTVSAAGCEVNEVSFSPINTTNSIEAQQTTLTVKFTGCADGIQIIPKSTRRVNTTQFIQESSDDLVEVKNNPSNLYLPGDKTTITVKYKLYEDGCYANSFGSDCNYYVNIKYLGNTVWNGREIIANTPVNQESTKNFQNGIMFASCGDGVLDVCDPANNSWEFVSSNVQVKADDECNLTQNDIQFINQPFTEIGEQTVSLKIKTKNKCTGIPIQVHLMSKVTAQGGSEAIDIDPEIEGEDYIQLIAEEGKDVVINFVGHDEECNASRNPDCHIYVDVKTNNGSLITSTKNLLPSTTILEASELQQFRQNSNFLKGVFIADCDGACGGKDWEYKTISGGYTNSPSQDNQASMVLPQGTYDTSSPCYDQGTGAYRDGCYELLAPIPGIGTQYTDGDGNVRDTGFQETADGRQTIDTKNIQLGDYINQIFRIALGILMVIAVIMVIIAGVQYMAVESIFGKTAAKERIVNALTGLLIGLGIFLILSTINPKLLEVNFSPKEVALNFVNDPAEIDKSISISSSGANNAPATNICNNRKSRGMLKSVAEKYQAITYTTQNSNLYSLSSSNLNLTNGLPKGTSIKDSVEASFAQKLINLNTKLKQKNITPRFTEVFGPSSLAHGSPCHYYGTCVDLATGTSSANASYSTNTVETIIRTADQVGLTAQFEFSKAQTKEAYQAMSNELASKGIDRCMILYVNHASNWHFSVYDKQDTSIKLGN
jgi:hypothetical protein